MAIKKSELYSSLWKSCDELRWSMDASQYKDYVLVLLFIKYVSDKYHGKDNALILIPEWWSFKDMIALKWKPDIWDQINKIIAKLADENELKWVIDQTDFNDEEKLWKWKDMVDTLSNLIAIFENPKLDFKNNKAEWDDILWDAYEYLMRQFATESWKSKWQFYTPAEVSRIISKVIWIHKSTTQSQTVYDPTCWSWSLLLKASDEAPHGLTIYWQEKDGATSALAKMNMILHWNPTAEIHKDNTLSKPFYKDNYWALKTFDYIVANPPFSVKSWASWFDPFNDEYLRFEDGVPPEKNWDYAFMLHIIKSLKSTWKAWVILPHGVLFRWNAEADIRRNLIKKWYIKWIIWLPANLFYGTWIPACIIVIDKENSTERKWIFMMDASKGFMKDGNKNRLRSQDLHKIVDVFNKWLEIDKYSRYVSLSEIEKNEYNLNIPRYIDTSETEDLQNIESHLKWWIPNADIDKMLDYFDVFKNLKNELFEEIRSGFSKIKIEENNIKETIFTNDEFVNYRKQTQNRFNTWKDKTTQIFKDLDVWIKPKQIIQDISEWLLVTFEEVALIDKYDMYQHLMDYWAETMQDDMYMIWIDWWVAKTYRILETNKKGKEVDKWWTCDLIPKNLIVEAYFKDQALALDNLNMELEDISRQMEEIVEENSWDEWLIEEAKADSWNISKASLTARIKQIEWDLEYKDELELLNKYADLLSKEAELKKQIKEADAELDKLAYNKYSSLTVEEIKNIVVDKKWMQTLENALTWELDKVSQTLAWRILELEERYKNTLPELNEKVETYESKVNEHLKKMWFSI